MPSGQKAQPAKDGSRDSKQPPPATKDAAAVEDRTVPAMDARVYNPGELMGKTIGGCRVDKLLGRGAMGAVYKARQLKLDRDVAVKVIRPEMMTDPRMLKRFEVEARTVGKFNSANVVMVHDVGFELGVHYLVMEFIKGKNLREHVKLLAGGRLPAGEALPLIRQACKGLDEARRLNVVHRDIKPDNLMLTEQGVLKIADFGIAKPQEDFSMTLTSELIGTPLYMSPEQCQGGADVDFRSDMYSLGATFFYLLTGEPPIRASSVYELIQTKTKLENLCLWKSLPELHENHPLSRVIERMTANDRDDRYESYEELLNDLVLVEAGETITVRPKKPKKVLAGEKAGSVAQPQKSGSRMLAIVLVLLVLGGGGGGYFWWANQQKPAQVPVVSSGGGDTGESVVAARKLLDEFRGRLRKSGPTQERLQELAAMKLPPALATERAQLTSDLEAGIAIVAALDKLPQLSEPKLPFDDVGQHFAAVDQAAAGSDKLGADVRASVLDRIKAVRAEDAIGAAAVAKLRTVFQDWRDARSKVTGDVTALASLGSQLTGIEAARGRLYDLFRGQRADLDNYLARADLDEARRKLAPKRTGGAGDEDIGPRLQQIRADFLSRGPEDSLLTSARQLVPVTEPDLKQRDDLINEMGRAAASKRTAQNTNDNFPNRPQAPEFTDVESFFAAIDRALEDVRLEGKLPVWAETLRTELRRESVLQRSVVRACEDLWVQWQGQQKAGAAAVLLDRDRRDIERAVARAKELFPTAAEELDKRVPLLELQAAMTTARATAQRGEWQGSLASTSSKLNGILSLAAWQASANDLLATQQSLQESLATVGEDPQLARDLQVFANSCAKWQKAKEGFDEAAQSLAGGSITACLKDLAATLAPVGARAEFDELKAVAERCRGAFVVLEQELDLTVAKSELEAAREVVNRMTLLPASVGARIDAWQVSIANLEGRATGMVPIAAGTTTNPRASVPAFFMAATECSNAEFLRFVTEVKERAVGETAAARLAAVATRLEGSGMDEKRLNDMLRSTSWSDDRRPVNANWYQASAYCAWYGFSLPKREEWALAAFGDGNKHLFPWGDSDSMKPEQRNPSSRAVDVDDGGLSWRSAQGLRLHHLAGNMAEWLAADGDTNSLQCDCVGSGFKDRPTSKTTEDLASGKTVKSENRLIPRSDVGFRVILRPRASRELSWPQ